MNRHTVPPAQTRQEKDTLFDSWAQAHGKRYRDAAKQVRGGDGGPSSGLSAPCLAPLRAPAPAVRCRPRRPLALSGIQRERPRTPPPPPPPPQAAARANWQQRLEEVAAVNRCGPLLWGGCPQALHSARAC